jgi:hypothetical protein
MCLSKTEKCCHGDVTASIASRVWQHICLMRKRTFCNLVVIQLVWILSVISIISASALDFVPIVEFKINVSDTTLTDLNHRLDK